MKRGPKPGPRTPFALWLHTAKPGDSFVRLKADDRNVIVDALRYGVRVQTERVAVVGGTPWKSTTTKAVLVTMVGIE